MLVVVVVVEVVEEVDKKRRSMFRFGLNVGMEGLESSV